MCTVLQLMGMAVGCYRGTGRLDRRTLELAETTLRTAYSWRLRRRGSSVKSSTVTHWIALLLAYFLYDVESNRKLSGRLI
jgi:hypothetical protein